MAIKNDNASPRDNFSLDVWLQQLENSLVQDLDNPRTKNLFQEKIKPLIVKLKKAPKDRDLAALLYYCEQWPKLKQPVEDTPVQPRPLFKTVSNTIATNLNHLPKPHPLLIDYLNHEEALFNLAETADEQEKILSRIVSFNAILQHPSEENFNNFITNFIVANNPLDPVIDPAIYHRIIEKFNFTIACSLNMVGIILLGIGLIMGCVAGSILFSPVLLVPAIMSALLGIILIKKIRDDQNLAENELKATPKKELLAVCSIYYANQLKLSMFANKAYPVVTDKVAKIKDDLYDKNFNKERFPAKIAQDSFINPRYT